MTQMPPPLPGEQPNPFAQPAQGPVAPPGGGFVPPPVFPVPDGIASAAVVLLSVHVLLDVLNVGASAWAVSLLVSIKRGNAVDQGLAGLVDGLSGIIAIVSSLCYIATVVVFCVWLHRTVKNAHTVGMKEPKPGWAVGSFFVPFVNLVVPFQAVSNASRVFSSAAGAGGHRPGVVPIWWTLWLVGNFAANIAARLIFKNAFGSSQPSLDELIGMAASDGISSLVLAGAGVACILMVKTLMRLQHDVARQFGAV